MNVTFHRRALLRIHQRFKQTKVDELQRLLCDRNDGEQSTYFVFFHIWVNFVINFVINFSPFFAIFPQFSPNFHPIFAQFFCKMLPLCKVQEAWGGVTTTTNYYGYKTTALSSANAYMLMYRKVVTNSGSDSPRDCRDSSSSVPGGRKAVRTILISANFCRLLNFNNLC